MSYNYLRNPSRMPHGGAIDTLTDPREALSSATFRRITPIVQSSIATQPVTEGAGRTM